MILLVGIILVCICFTQMYLRNRSLRLDRENFEFEVRIAKNNLQTYRTINVRQVDILKSQIDSLNSLNRSLMGQNTMLRHQNRELEEAIKRYQIAQRIMPQVPPETVEAVKYAMKKAHPDNGGKVEDFKKFRKCYEELTGK